jgi:signal recognition particle receptor subunit beta
VIAEIARSLARALPGAAAEDIADILWLAAARRLDPDRPQPFPQRTPGQHRGPETPPALPQVAVGEAADAAVPQRTDKRALLLRDADDAVAKDKRPVAATAVGLRAPRTVSPAIGDGRMFSPFRRIHRPGPREVDVSATVEATADARRLTIVTRRASERGLDVALVADASSVMTACADMVAELEAILIRSAAFRSVSRWTLAPQADEVLVRDRAGAEHLPGRLVDPSGRRLVLIVTDTTADHWYRSSLWQAIRNWANLMPTAVIHVLPVQYRSSGPLGAASIAMRATRPAAANSTADVDVPWWSSTADGGDMVPLPVVAANPWDLADWARATAIGTSWVSATWARQPVGHSPRTANARVGTADRVRVFHARASRGAQALARVLAEAPVLSLPMIKVVQSRLLPDTSSGELAELLVSGLLEQVPAPALSDRDLRFRFRDAASALLRRGITADQEWDIFEAVSDYLEQKAGPGNSILALVADPQGSSTVDATLAPFAAFGRAIALRLGLLSGESGNFSVEGAEVDRGTEEEKPGTVTAETYPPTGEFRVTRIKVVIAGGYGAGKSEFIFRTSEILPVTSEALISVASTGIDDLSHVPDKHTMTAALDFGRVTLERDLVVHAFGTPGVHRMWYLWDDLIQGAIGAVVLADTRRLADSFPAVDYFEATGLPFIIAVNGFHGQFGHRLDVVRDALSIPSSVPVIQCDARNRESAKATLVALIEHALSLSAREDSEQARLARRAVPGGPAPGEGPALCYR